MHFETAKEGAPVETKIPRQAAFATGAAPAAETSSAADPALHPQIGEAILEIEGLNLWYGEKQALFDVSMRIPKKKITAYPPAGDPTTRPPTHNPE